jgi:hypothetical protein
LTHGGFSPQLSGVTRSAATPFQNTVRWLSAYVGFPAARLPARAEILLLISTAAEEEQVALQRSPRFLIERNDKASDSSLKAYTMNRSLAHYVSNNGQKT